MTGCREMLKKCLFFTPISPFLAKKFFFSKIGLHQSLGAAKSYLDTKNQKILMSRSSGISRKDGQTDGQTDGRGQIHRTLPHR